MNLKNTLDNTNRDNVDSPLLLNFLNVLDSDGTAAPGTEGARLLPGRAFPRDDQRLRRSDNGRSKQEIRRFRVCTEDIVLASVIHIAFMHN